MLKIALLTLLVFCSICYQAETYSITTWNLEWFPGHKPIAKAAEKAAHMVAAKAALEQIPTDIFCGQEVSDWNAFTHLVTCTPTLKTVVVSRHKDTEKSRGYSRQQIGIAARD